MTRIEPIKYVT